MPSDVQLNLKLDATAKQQIDDAIFDGVQEVFEIDIKGDAVENSPVKTGHNRRTIDTEVARTPRGVEAAIFTQSGYGGYLEIGTYVMKERPYIFPAFNKFRAKIGELIGAKIAMVRRSAATKTGTYKQRLDALQGED